MRTRRVLMEMSLGVADTLWSMIVTTGERYLSVAAGVETTSLRFIVRYESPSKIPLCTNYYIISNAYQCLVYFYLIRKVSGTKA